MTKAGAKTRIVMGAGVAVIATVILGWLLVSRPKASEMWQGKINRDEFVMMREEQFTGEIEQVDVEWVAGDITILPARDNVVRVKQMGMPGNTIKQEVIEVKNKTLVIDENPPRKFSLENFNWRERVTDLEIYLPEKIYRQFELSNVSGRIVAEQVSVDELDLELVSGEAFLGGNFEKVEVDLVSGEAEIKSLTCPRDFSADVVSGNLTLRIPDNEGFRLKVDKISGSFNSDFPMSNQKQIYTYKNGRADFQVDLMSGNLAVWKLEN